MQSIEELCKQLGSSDQVKAYQARKVLTRRAVEAGKPGNNKARAELAAALAEALVATTDGKDPRGRDAKVGVYSVPARRDIAQVLSLVAGEAEVAVVEKGLADFDIRESVRFVLDRCPAAAATDALCKATETPAGTEFVVGVVNALGRRSGSNVVARLKKLLNSNSIEIRLAAAEALSSVPDPALDEKFVKLRRGGEPGTGQRGNHRVQRVRVRLAETLAAAGQKDAARKICKSLVEDESGVPAAQRKAAEVILAQLG